MLALFAEMAAGMTVGVLVRRWVGMVGSLVALVGFASTANASATIDLLWSNGQATISSVESSEIITLEVVLTAGANGSNGASVSVEFDDLMLTFVSSLNAADDETFAFSVGPSVFNGSNQVNFINDGALPPYLGSGLASFASHSLGTIVFHMLDESGIANVDVLINVENAVLDGGGNNITGTTTFNSATINNAPEPGTISLLALGLCGLALAARR